MHIHLVLFKSYAHQYNLMQFNPALPLTLLLHGYNLSVLFENFRRMITTSETLESLNMKHSSTSPPSAMTSVIHIEKNDNLSN